jgi:hypothetical protein
MSAPLAAALRSLVTAACHARGCASQHVDRRRRDADPFGFGPCDCGLRPALQAAALALLDAGAMTPEIQELVDDELGA